MISDKIRTTSNIRAMIAIKRKEKGLSGSDLSSMLHLTSSYISSIENNHIKSISKANFVQIVKILYDVSEDDAVKIIENSLKNPIKIDPTLNNDVAMPQQILNSDEIKTYKTIENHADESTIDDLIENIKKGFKVFYKHNPDFTISTLKRFTASFHFDIGFMMVILRTPFFAFKGLGHDERQAFLDELSKSFNKFALESKEHLEQQNKNINLESTKNDTSTAADTPSKSKSGSGTDLQHNDNA